MSVVSRVIRLIALAAALCAADVVLSAPALAQDSLSDYLNRKIREAKRAESEKKFEVALDVYKNAIEREAIPPDAMRVLLKRRAGVYEAIGMPEAAEADLNAALKVQPFDPKVYADRGYFYLRGNRYQPALDDFMAGAQYEPANPLFRYGQARVMMAKGDFASAVAFYDQAVALNPTDGKLYLARGEAQIRLNNYPAARRDYEKAVTLGLHDPTENFFATMGFGYVDLVQTHYAAAIHNFDLALGFNPQSVRAHLWRGYAYERAGDRDAALIDYEQALTMSPSFAEAGNAIRRLRSAEPRVTPGSRASAAN